MKCPKCDDPKYRYNQRKPEKLKEKVMFTRTDFSARCKSCGWEDKA